METIFKSHSEPIFRKQISILKCPVFFVWDVVCNEANLPDYLGIMQAKVNRYKSESTDCFYFS